MTNSTNEELIKELCFEWFKIGFRFGVKTVIDDSTGSSLENDFEELWKTKGL